MKTLKNLLFLCSLAVLTACSDDAYLPQSEVVPTAESGSIDYISMTVPDIEIDDATTRSKLIDDGTELKFVWQENDAIGVVPMNGWSLGFPIHSENAQGNTAVFDGGDWALKTDTKYAAFFPFDKKISEKDIRHIPIDYTGQTQANWMKYDFLATGAVKPKDGAVKFTMKRLSTILKIKAAFYANNISKIRYVTLVAPEPLFGAKGTLDLSGSEPVYTPENLTKFINTDMGVDKSLSSSSQMIYFTFYLMIPPTDLSGKELKLIFNSDLGTAKEATFNGQNFEAGKAYSIIVSASDAFIRNSNLIAAAGLSDVANYKGVNAWAYRERILQVKSINVSNLDDPTVCDEIGFFRNLEELRCPGNKITYLDLSYNPKLTNLSCNTNQLASLDVSNNTALTTLYCNSNKLNSLDVSNNPAVEELQCYSNPLTSLDLSKNTQLTTLNCSSNQLTSLDLAKNTQLTTFSCNSNQLTSLDLSYNPALVSLSCSSNQLTSLDVSNNAALKELYCYSNQVASLDVSNCPALTNLSCYSNQLISLDVSNCPALANLQCYSNQLTSLDVSNCPALINLYCYSNQLTSLDVSSNTALNTLSCFSNRLTSLDVSKCPLITWPKLGCGKQFDASGNYQYIFVSGNEAMMEYYFEKGTIYDPTNVNYYVNYEGDKFP